VSGAVVSSGVVSLSTGRVNAYLMPDAVIEAQTHAVVGLAGDLRQFTADDDEFVRRAHDWVSEVIAWPADLGERRVPITSMEVLFTGIGCTFGRSHLLAALLRAGGVPAALCYTRRPLDLAVQAEVAAYLDHAWRRVRSHGCTPWDTPPRLFASPPPKVISALHSAPT
jgi:hypothetical protein